MRSRRMSEMVERVGKAMLDEASDLHGANYTWEIWQMEYTALARTAIKVMREPTLEMLRFGQAPGGPILPVWQAMIDAALKEQHEEGGQDDIKT